ncbi:uncharacterized protein LOC116288275 [Actinia tenebrosa]|uniref:Uncharacterized protein LOC116288275 n=1 Tax=Actinia tenebrosa TaxID=6105 RepID=A0A6P8H6B2_ACTTE|nr:uncharacterized protein LOC116288275 [Actinia tenebrosa]
MLLLTPSHTVVFFVLCIFGHLMDTALSCDKDARCKPHQVCCGKRCRSWPKCFLNSDMECYYDTHCIKAAVCVSNVCKPRKLLPTSCKTDEDCSFQKHSKSFDGIVSTSKCCQGKCFKTKSCLALKINSTLTTPTTSQAIGEQPCLETTKCPSELECINARCRVKKVVDSAKRNSKESDTTLSKAGFLSAAILTAAVFLTIMCFCFLKETKYAQRHYMRRAQRETLTQSNYLITVGQPSAVFHDQPDQTHSSNSRNNNRAFQISASWMLFPGLYGSNQTERSHGDEERNREEEEGDCSSSCTRPPSYRSVCFDHELPPSYDEAMNCDHCQNYTHNITLTTGCNIQNDQQSASLA